MKTSSYKSILVLILTLVTLPLMSQDFMNIYFKNGDFRKFYMKNITEIVASKVDKEGVQHGDYCSQSITTIYDTYVYNLEDVDSITFTKIDEEKAEQNFVTAMPEVFTAIEDCETIDDVEDKIDEIKNTEGVAEAWSDGHELHISLEEGETFSFHFNHNTTINENLARGLTNNIRAMKPIFGSIAKEKGSSLKAVIANQWDKNEESSWEKSKLFFPLIDVFKECGIDAYYEPNPTVDFFYNNSDNPERLHFYDYDIVMLITHGSYEGPHPYVLKNGPYNPIEFDSHNFVTIEDIEIVGKEPHPLTWWGDFYNRFKQWRDNSPYKDLTDIQLNFGFTEEKRNGDSVWVLHPVLTEYFFKDIAPGEFNNPNSFLFNCACLSLKGVEDDQPSFSFANILFDKHKLGVYAGYTETNFSGRITGTDLLFHMLAGESIEYSYENLVEWCKKETKQNIVENDISFQYFHGKELWEDVRDDKDHAFDAELIIFDKTGKIPSNFFLFPTITVKPNKNIINQEFLSNQAVTLHGFTTLSNKSTEWDGFNHSEIELGFEFGATPYLNELLRFNTSVKKQRVVNSELGNYQFETTISNLTPDKTYYYRAYTFDGLRTNYGETYEFKIDKPEDPVDNDIITFTDENVKAICVKKWDKNGDGELSKEEAAAVTDLGEEFRINNEFSFNELQYFTGLTTIGDYAFSGSGLTSVIIPNSVTSIGFSAFQGCSKLSSLTIPEGVTSFGTMAFGYCTSLTSVTIPSTITSWGTEAFFGCGLTSVTFAEGLRSVGEHQDFAQCKNLTSIVIPEGVTSIGNVTFVDCEKLASVELPSSLATIGWGSFSGTGLTSVVIPSSVTSIGEGNLFIHGAFYGCGSLTSIKVERGNTIYDSRDNCNAIIKTETNELIAGCMNTVIPNSVMKIADSAFQGCIGLTSITIPNSVISIGEQAFQSCISLASITIPNSVTTIGDHAFRACFGLSSVTIPNSLTSIGYETFMDCSSLKEVHSMIEDPFAFYNVLFGFYNDNHEEQFTTATLYVPTGTKAKYEATEGWKNFQNIVEEGDTPPVTTHCPDDHHPHFIDLGLPSGLKWACCNIEASKPEEYGKWFAWGELSPNWYIHTNEYSMDKTGQFYMTKYCTDGRYGDVDDIISLDLADDVAHVKLGGNKRMPSSDEVKELIDNCTTEWTTLNGKSVLKFYGQNGASICFPATGYWSYGQRDGVEYDGLYWTRSLNTDPCYMADVLWISEEGAEVSSDERYKCKTVRAVMPDGPSEIVDFKVADMYPELKSGETRTINIRSGNGNYSINMKPDNLVKTTIKDASVELSALKEGTAKIYITDKASGQTIVIKATVIPEKETPAEAIDLGLPSGTKWASYNIGATKPSDYGGYYAWGEVEAKNEYNWLSYLHCDGTAQSCYDLGKDIAGTKYDIAQMKWGGSWRMPTVEQLDELMHNCTMEPVTIDNVKGVRYTGPNKKSIFIPLSGYIVDKELLERGEKGKYWTSLSIDSYYNSHYSIPDGQAIIREYEYMEYGEYESFNDRCFGLTVRPVKK